MHEDSPKRKLIQWTGLAMGPVLAVVCLWILPTEFVKVDTVENANDNRVQAAESDDSTDSMVETQTSEVTQQFSWAGRATLAVMVWMGVWWLTEAIDISATALLPIVLFPLLGAATISDATFPYANPLIFLFMGGFIIALSMERWGLGKRIALLSLNVVGTSPSGMIAGFMLVTAVLSAFVSNTATTAMMLPIAMSVIALLRTESKADREVSEESISGFGTCLMLAIAYSASVGGVMTIIGTPTNAFLVGFLKNDIATEYRMDISFTGWLPIGVSLAVVFLPIIFLMLTRVLYPIKGLKLSGGRELIGSELSSIGKMNRGEWITFLVFVVTVSLWLFRKLLAKIQFDIGETTFTPFAGLTDYGIAMIGAMLLFLIPVNIKKREFAMDWKTAEKFPWGILILFGGGLSLAAAVKSNGVAEFIGSQAGMFGDVPPIVLVLIVTAVIVFLTELTSNVATTTALVPVLAALAPGLGVHPYLLIFPATVAASCAFMLPVATPPNAIVFASNEVTLPQMARAGVMLNLIAIVLVTLLAMFVVKPWLGI